MALVFILLSINYNNFHKIKKNKTTIKKLKTSATIDFLTNTYNREAGFSHLKKLLYESDKNKTIFSICFIDLNNLKKVNDTFGHNEGDEYIKLVVTLINKGLSEEHILFRFGGDEFIIIFPNTKIIEARKTMNIIDEYFQENKKSVYEVRCEVGISYGFAEYNPYEPLEIKELIDIADKEMYIHKRESKLKK
jgi:diguanylate cyclase (GGDEF)-like protein